MSKFVDKKFKLEIVIISQFLSCFRPGGCVFGHGSFVVWGHHFRSTFIASTDKYIINNEEKRGEEDEQVFSGSRIRHYWFADFIILFRGFHPLQYIVILYRGYKRWIYCLYSIEDIKDEYIVYAL